MDIENFLEYMNREIETDEFNHYYLDEGNMRYLLMTFLENNKNI